MYRLTLLMKTLFRFSLTVEKKQKSFSFVSSSRKRRINKLSALTHSLKCLKQENNSFA